MISHVCAVAGLWALQELSGMVRLRVADTRDLQVAVRVWVPGPHVVVQVLHCDDSQLKDQENMKDAHHHAELHWWHVAMR